MEHQMMDTNKTRRRLFVGDIVSFTIDAAKFIGMVMKRTETGCWEVCVPTPDKNHMYQLRREDLLLADPSLFIIYNNR